MIVSAENPLGWRPDPYGAFHSERYRWHGFKKFKTKYWMKDAGMANIDKFRTLRGSELYKWDSTIDNTGSYRLSTDEKINEYAVYQHMSIYDGKKYITYVNDEMTDIGMMMPIADFLPAVDKLTMGMKGDLWPLVCSFRAPQRNNYTGISVMDLSADKQVELSKLANLALKRAIRVSLGGHKFYNINKIKNKKDLERMGVMPKVIGVDLKQGESM